MQIVSTGDNLHEISNPVFLENMKTILVCRRLNVLPECSALKYSVINVINVTVV